MRFVCELCRLGDHGNCKGTTWCDCQHKRKGLS